MFPSLVTQVYTIAVKRSEIIFGLLRIPLDALAVAAALLVGYRLREASIDLIPGVQLLEPPLSLPSIPVYMDTFVVPAVGAFLLIAAVLSLYSLKASRSAWREVGGVIIASLLWLVVVIAWYFLVAKQLFYSRVLLVHSVMLITVFVTSARAAITLLQRAMLYRGIGVRLAVSIGALPIPIAARYALEHDRSYHYVGHLADIGALRRLSKKHAFDLVLQTDPDAGGTATAELIEECRSRHMGYAFLPPILADVPHQLHVERLGLLPMIRFQPTPLDGWGRVWKRLFDILLSLGVIILLSPILLLIAIAIVIDSGFPIFYVSRRVGEHGRSFVPALKFRSMVRDADARKTELFAKNERQDGPLFKLRDDPRITRIGRALRRFDLDELPQLFNVFLGQMSLVGPRPHLPDEVSRYTSFQRRVFAVKPGITGLSQVSGRSALLFEEEVQFDLRYIEEWSPWLEVWILWRTIFVVLQGKSQG